MAVLVYAVCELVEHVTQQQPTPQMPTANVKNICKQLGNIGEYQVQRLLKAAGYTMKALDIYAHHFQLKAETIQRRWPTLKGMDRVLNDDIYQNTAMAAQAQLNLKVAMEIDPPSVTSESDVHSSGAGVDGGWE